MLRLLAAALLLVLLPVRAVAEDGYDLWLRYAPLGEDQAEAWRGRTRAIVLPQGGETLTLAARELRSGLEALLGREVPLVGGPRRGAVLLGTPETEPLLADLDLGLETVGEEGYVLRETTVEGRPVTVIAANTEIGALYGAFAYLRAVQTGTGPLDVAEAPGTKIRVLNHWDNLDRSVERGYAGQSLWDWQKLPGYKDPRYADYARANASLGLNGTVLTNVNANALVLTPRYLEKVAALAEVFRPYGIKTYLTARFSAPVEIGGLETADPLDPQVVAWWKAKADEIYEAVPDFGGFLVKANSEGQPGPQDYGRTHAEGANMLADAVAPHGGVVMWRAFVYSAEEPDDRVKQAYDEFVPLDGRFRGNVLVQVKNGPLDFQPREPVHPLFGAMPQTPLMAELQVTKEYLGFATHLVFLGPMWTEALGTDTFAEGEGSTVARVVDGSLNDHALTGMAGVANIGSDRNWSGSQFDQANWYAFGRLAWDPDARAEDLAREWAAQTFTRDEDALGTIVSMMMRSRQAAVDYMTPLGLTHLMATGHHYGPGPWVGDLPRGDWNPVYYHRADEDGIGFDRTGTGSDAAAQYEEVLRRRYLEEDEDGDYLLWFRHVAWDDELPSGRTVWEELVHRYDRGIAEVASMQADWRTLRPAIDARRWAEVRDFLAIQREEAQWWRDASLAYWMSVNGLDLPGGARAVPHDLAYYQAIDHPNAPGN